MIAEKMKAVQGRDIVRMATEKPMSEAAQGKEAESHLVPGSITRRSEQRPLEDVSLLSTSSAY
jgi:hypothetical protein